VCLFNLDEGGGCWCFCSYMWKASRVFLCAFIEMKREKVFKKGNGWFSWLLWWLLCRKGVRGLHVSCVVEGVACGGGGSVVVSHISYLEWIGLRSRGVTTLAHPHSLSLCICVLCFYSQESVSEWSLLSIYYVSGLYDGCSVDGFFLVFSFLVFDLLSGGSL